jgi:hypothetical protein
MEFHEKLFESRTFHEKLFESRTFHEKFFLKVIPLSVRRGAYAIFWGGATLILLNVLHGSLKITKHLPSKRVGKLVKKHVFKFGDSLFEGNVISEHLEEGFWKFFVT